MSKPVPGSAYFLYSPLRVFSRRVHPKRNHLAIHAQLSAPFPCLLVPMNANCSAVVNCSTVVALRRYLKIVASIIETVVVLVVDYHSLRGIHQ